MPGDVRNYTEKSPGKRSRTRSRWWRSYSVRHRECDQHSTNML